MQDVGGKRASLGLAVQITDVVSVLQSQYGFTPPVLQHMLDYCPWILTQSVDKLAEHHEFLRVLVGLSSAQVLPQRRCLALPLSW